MKIGIDIDDTICMTSESLNKYAKIYAKEKNISTGDIFIDNEERYKFLRKYYYNIISKALVKEDFNKVLSKLEKNNKLYFISARNNNYLDDNINIDDITLKWLDENNIKYEKFYSNCYMEEKVKIIKENKIDVVIDDDFRNYITFKKNNIKTFLYDDKNMYGDVVDSRKSWEEIIKEI